VWTIHSVAYDNSIQSGRSALIRYEFNIPANIRGPLTVTARVNYRHLRPSYLNNVLEKVTRVSGGGNRFAHTDFVSGDERGDGARCAG